MAETSIDVDRVVREVLAQLGLAPDSPTSPQPQAGKELVVSCRVVTLSEVEGRLEAVRRLVVPPQAVITPAVRDELRRRDVALAFASQAVPSGAGRLRLVLVTAGKQPVGGDSVGDPVQGSLVSPSETPPTSLVHALSKEPVQLEQHTCDCLIAATDQLAGEVGRPDTLGLLLTRHTAAALCLANRHAGVQAVSGTETGTVAAAADSVGANLLVIDPTAQTGSQLKQVVTEFCRGGTRQCPEVFRERLA